MGNKCVHNFKIRIHIFNSNIGYGVITKRICINCVMPKKFTSGCKLRIFLGLELQWMIQYYSFSIIVKLTFSWTISCLHHHTFALFFELLKHLSIVEPWVCQLSKFIFNYQTPSLRTYKNIDLRVACTLTFLKKLINQTTHIHNNKYVMY